MKRAALVALNKRRALALLLSCGFLQTGFASEKPAVIPEVNTHAGASPSSKAKSRPQTTQITREDIKTSPITNVAELLKREQSIARLTNNSGDSTQVALSIRGFGDNAASNSLILIDGFPLTNPTLLAPNFNSIALLDIEKIDIFQGSQGVLWGDQAVGGVVNITTRHPEKRIFDTSSGLGSFNQVYYSGLLGNRFENGLFAKALGFSNKTDNYRAHNQQSDNTLYAQAGMDYARGTIRLSVQSFNNHVNFPGGLTQSQYDAHPRDAVNYVNFSSYKTNRYLLLNKQTLNDNWLLETRLARHEINGDGFMHSAFNRYEWMNSLEPRLIGNISGNKVILGYEGQNSAYRLQNAQVNQRAAAWQNNLFAQVVVPIYSRWEATLGMRSAWQRNHTERVVGQAVNAATHVGVAEAGLGFHPADGWTLYLRRSGNFRFPKVNEETWTPPGVTSLQVQSGVSYEGGVSWQTQRQQMQFNLYQLQLRDEIAFDPTETPERPFGSFSNFDKTLRRGATVTERFGLTDKLNLNGQLNYVNARFASGAFSGKQIPAVPAVNGNLGLDYEFRSSWRVLYTALYTGSRYASEDEQNAGKILAGYWLSTAALQYETTYALISLEAGNLFNQKYSVYTLYDASTHTNTYYSGAGRSILLTLKTNLD